MAEGPKVVGDMLLSAKPKKVIATRQWYSEAGYKPREEDIVASPEELRKASLLQHPQQVIAIFPIPKPQLTMDDITNSLSLLLVDVQDPGNVGTIIRLASWFGIKNIICSRQTADAYNPKAVQATMGSLLEAHIIYTDAAALLDSLPGDFPVYGTFLDGEDIYRQPLTKNGLIVMGNEGNGIPEEVAGKITRRLFVPTYNLDKSRAESLNVAIATAIVASEFRRREHYL